MDVNNFWDDNYYQHPVLTEEMIAFAEHSLGKKLPLNLIKLLKIQNGGYTKAFVFPMKQKTSWAANHISVSKLFGIVTDKSVQTAQNILHTNYIIQEWGLPENQVLLCGNGPCWITLDYRTGNEPSIRWIDAECDEDIHIADNFDAFIDGLVSE